MTGPADPGTRPAGPADPRPSGPADPRPSGPPDPRPSGPDPGRRPVRCAVASAGVEEPLPGTAPRARLWVVLEQPGPWGARAVESCHLPAAVSAALTRVGQGPDTTVVLARRPGPHADDRHRDHPRRFWVARTDLGAVELRTGLVDRAADILGWDLDRLAAGDLPDLGRPASGPLLLVCTNGRRDLCCALAGRVLVADLCPDHRPGPGSTGPVHRPADLGAGGRADLDDWPTVWECSHLGGHRFAPTALLLPWGAAYGRLDATVARQVLAAARNGRLHLTGYRGRTCLSRPEQAAERMVRAAADVTGLADLVAVHDLPGDDPAGRVRVVHRDGRTWLVPVHRRVLDPPRPESCGGDPVAPDAWLAGTPQPAEPVPPAGAAQRSDPAGTVRTWPSSPPPPLSDRRFPT